MARDDVYGAWINYCNNKKKESPNLTLHEFEEELRTGNKYIQETKEFYNKQVKESKSTQYDWEEDDELQDIVDD